MRLASGSSRYRLAVIGLFCALGLATALAASAQPQPVPGEQPAEPPAPIYTEVPIPVPNVETTPGSSVEKRMEYLTEGKVEDLAQYLGIIYNFMISIAGLVASVMLIVGGFQYVTSAGDAGKVGAAKTRMINAIMGLLLALGAYTVLLTINPALVKLQLPTGIKNVQSEIALLAWCEDLMAKGIAVTNIMTEIKCGAVGTYKNGKSELPCVYYGQCGANKNPSTEAATYISDTWATCLQIPGGTGDDGVWVKFSPDIYLQLAKEKKDDIQVARCVNCAKINAKWAKDNGYPSLDLACQTWSRSMNSQFYTKFGQGSQYWAYCAYAGDKIEGKDTIDSCLQMDIDCQAADSNPDAGTSCDPNCGCNGYDDSPKPWYGSRVGADGYINQVSAQGCTVFDDGNCSTADDTSAYHLGQLCRKNPCYGYKNTSTGKENFKKGCTFEGELTQQITTDFNIDCRNN